MTDNSENSRLRTGLMSAIAYLKHFKGDAECKLPSFPDSIQTAIDDIQSVLDGGNAGDVYRRMLATSTPSYAAVFKDRPGLDELVKGAALS